MMPSKHSPSAEPLVPWTNVYGLARSALALGTLLTLLLHDADTLFRPLGVSVATQLDNDLLLHWSVFSLVGDTRLYLARWACIVVLLLVVVGWRPRWTALLHWWITWSLAGSSVLIDGGEQVATVLTFLMLPLALTDPRRWHWERYTTPAEGATVGWHAQHVLALASALLMRLQVAAIYFEAAVAKVAVPEWKNGTALYYWFSDPGFGMPDWLEPLLRPVMTNSLGVTVATWSVIVLEATLFLGLTMERRWRRLLLPVALLFHLAIVFVHGLAIFFLSMMAALLVYLRPLEDELHWPMHRINRFRASLRPVMLRFHLVTQARA